ncbi:PLD nuclease N-terminal domain-containing protein [Nonomuraea sp. NPDC050536]|uniref:PLD nuclease N-terminal domain-containing protein n=1 Tax=Nonomuraea sp. NPDC050536 TaxID=3364366 RepID=UPI0037C92E48
MWQRRRWRDLTQRQQTAILVMASIEWALTATAAVDLWFRPRNAVRGRKSLWWPALLVQPVGPIAYLLMGRRNEGDRSCASRT